jgi:hypothetical protein
MTNPDREKEKRDRRIAKAKTQPADELPPHSSEAEAAALGCILLAAEAGSPAEADEMLRQLRPAHFYELRHAIIFDAMRFLRQDNHAIDMVTLMQWLKDKGQLEGVGGMGYVAGLPDQAPSFFNFGEYLTTLRDKAHRRWMIAKACELTALAGEPVVTLEDTQARLSELFDATQKATAAAPMLEIIDPAEAARFEADPADFLIGQGLICRDQFITIGGPPGCGKSRLATTLAVAGARGNACWQGYPVRSRFRTLILQTENKGNRLKEEFACVPAELHEHIRISKSLSHGLAFGNPEFRREVTRYFDKWPFELLELDPWNDVVSDEGQSDYAEALLNIQRCFWGRKMPAVIIVAHLRKTGRDATGKRKSGRDLLNELSGSLKLGSASRTVFAVQPASNRMDDDRIVFEVAKANDADPAWLSEHGTRSAWYRRNAAFERCAEFDWEEWQNGDSERNEQKRAITREMIEAIFDRERRQGMKRGELAKHMAAAYDIGESTAYRVIGQDGYAGAWLIEAGGVVAMKKGEA